MKKTLLILKSFLIIFLLTFSANLAKGQIQYEAFDYTIPGFVGGNGAVGTSSNYWTTHSLTTGQTTTIDLYSGSLSYSGLKASAGNRVLLPGTNSTVSRDINTPITTSSTVIYYSALINVLDNTQLSASSSDYFMSLGATAGTSVTVLGARLGIKSVNSAANYRLSICNTSGTGTSYTDYAVDLNFATTYLVVVKYDRSTSPTVATLWVNPITLGSSEPSGSVSNSGSSSTFNAFASICLRNGTSTPKVEIDEIRVGSSFADVTPISGETDPPVASFNPATGATDVLAWVKPSISFDEAVRKTDGTDLVDADLATLVTFKKTDALGADVPFTATISTDKKLITVTPSSNLDNLQAYYLAIAPVEDGFGNEATLKSATFTTISGSTPVITLTNPVGGETLIANDPYTFRWNSASVTNVNIEAWAITDNVARTYGWIPIASDISAAAGKYDFTIPGDASYGTEYKIRISDASNASLNTVSGTFTLYASATSVPLLRARSIANDIVRLTGETTVTFKRATGNTKYIQDANAGLMIYDVAGTLKTTLNIGDNFTGLIGKIALYNGVMEFIPVSASVTVTSTGNTPTIPEMTLTDYNTNYALYESRLIRLSDVSFTNGDGTLTFSASTSYATLTDGTTTITLRTWATGESDIIGSVIPIATAHRRLTCLGVFYTTTGTVVQVQPRTLADFDFLEAAELTSADKPVVYPIPARDVLRIKNIANVSHADILDASGRVIRSASVNGDDEVAIPVSDLKKGMYFLRLTTPSGKVTTKFIK